MVFNATFNNISVISWQSVLLVVKTGVPEKTIELSQVIDKLYHIMLYRFLVFNTTFSNISATSWCPQQSPKEHVDQVSANILNIAGRISNYALGNRKCKYARFFANN
jgi:hypothetical protein